MITAWQNTNKLKRLENIETEHTRAPTRRREMLHVQRELDRKLARLHRKVTRRK